MSIEDHESFRTSPWTACSVIVLIGAHAIFLAMSAAKNSVTFDEAAHLPAGCAYLKYREFSIYNYNPPLLRMLAAWPVLLAGADVPDAARFRKFAPQDRIWFYCFAFQRANSVNYHRLFLLGRMALVPISCLGAWIIFAWTRQLYGRDAPALAACALWTLDPDILAHASIVGTDIGAAVAMMLALWAWQRFCQQPGARRALMAGIAVAGAHLCKFTALMLWPAMGAILVWALIRNRATLRLRDLAAGYVVAIILTFVLVNLCYGYDRSFEPMRTLPLQSRAMQAVQRRLGSLPSPLPRQLLLGLDALKWECEMRLPGFLLGESYRGGRWNYYPVALACKLPISVLALLAMTIISFIGPGRGALSASSSEIWIIIAVVTLALGVLFEPNLNLGVRYLLPLYPLTFILIARLWKLGAKIRAASWTMLALLAVESLWICPRYLTFFNAFAGGRANGWKIVNDSNFDWGQGLIDLKKWIDQNRAGRIELAYFGIVDPSLYQIDYAPFGQGADERYVAISSYLLAGQRQRIASTHGDPRPIQIPYYRELQKKMPVGVPSGTIFVFTREDFEAAKRGD